MVIGVGGAGSAIAERAAALGLRVIGVDPKDIPPSAAVERIVPPDMLREVLPQANVVFMSAPLTAATHHMLRRAFAALPSGACLINVSRGGTVDTDALVEALRAQGPSALDPGQRHSHPAHGRRLGQPARAPARALHGEHPPIRPGSAAAQPGGQGEGVLGTPLLLADTVA